ILREFFEFCAADQSLPEAGSIAGHLRITVMIKLTKIENFKIGEKGIALAQCRIMNAQISLDDFPPCLDRPETVQSSSAIAIVTAQIGERLFAFKNCGAIALTTLPKCGDIGAEPTVRQVNLKRTS